MATTTQARHESNVTAAERIVRRELLRRQQRGSGERARQAALGRCIRLADRLAEALDRLECAYEGAGDGFIAEVARGARWTTETAAAGLESDYLEFMDPYHAKRDRLA